MKFFLILDMVSHSFKALIEEKFSSKSYLSILILKIKLNLINKHNKIYKNNRKLWQSSKSKKNKWR